MTNWDDANFNVPDLPGLPSKLEEVTPEFLTTILQFRYPSLSVDGVEFRNVIHGASTTMLLTLDYGRTGEPCPPADVVLKAGFAEGRLEWLAPALALEAIMYGRVLPNLPVDSIPCHAALRDSSTGQTVVLLDDVIAAGGSWGSGLVPMSIDEMAQLLDSVAQLHALWWGDPALDKRKWLPVNFDPSNPWSMECTIYPPSKIKYMLNETQRGEIIPYKFHQPDLLSRSMLALGQLSAVQPRALLHGDLHLDNLYRTPDGGRWAMADWQAPRQGCWAWDVNKMLITDLPVEARRRAEKDLLRHYLDRLTAYGASPPSFDEAWLAHRRFSIYELVVTITNTDDYHPRSVNVARAERAVAAAMDLDTLAACADLLAD